MEIVNTEFVRHQLQERREKLQEAIPLTKNADPLLSLLKEVDTALEKIAKGTYGICETCHDSIEAERLVVDPFIRNCLDHLTRSEQQTLERDLDLAYEVQKNLLPKQGLRVHGWETAYHYAPAGSVSGDYCDLIDVGRQTSTDPAGDCLYFLIGDVAGKGVAASILMAHLHAVFRSLVHAKHPFERLMDEANRLFCEGALSTHFATLVCGRANAKGEVELSNAGHVPPFIVRAAAVEKIPPTGIPLGMFCNSGYTARSFSLGKGESLVLYTDGVTETKSPDGTFYGEENLTKLIGSAPAHAAHELVAACVDELKTHRGGGAKTDDVTIMAIKRV